MDNIAENSWVQYQKLVLAELERHNDRQTDFDKELVEVKLTQARMMNEITNLANSTKSLAESIKISVDDMKSTKSDMITQKIEMNDLKTRLGLICVGVSMICSGGVAAAFKYWLHI